MLLWGEFVCWLFCEGRNNQLFLQGFNYNYHDVMSFLHAKKLYDLWKVFFFWSPQLWEDQETNSPHTQTNSHAMSRQNRVSPHKVKKNWHGLCCVKRVPESSNIYPITLNVIYTVYKIIKWVIMLAYHKYYVTYMHYTYFQ